MSKSVTMPALSPTMEKGTLARWLVAVGDAVKAGDVLAEVETDKAIMEIEADEAGVIRAFLISAGTEGVKVGTAIASIGTAGEADDAPPPPTPPEPLAGEIAAASWTDPAAASNAVVRAPRTDATPLALRIAGGRGIDLNDMRGSGAAGRVRLVDVMPPARAPLLARRIAAAPPSANSQAAVLPTDIPHQTMRLSQMRRTIARRLTEAKQTIPHFYLTVHLKVDALLALRKELNGRLASRGVRLSVNDMLIKAVALALADTPDANVQFAGEILRRFERVDVAVAVPIPDGLITPVIHDAAAKPLAVISAEARALAVRARGGKLAPHEYEGGTASISNLGMFGIDEIIPVINPPHSLILGVGAIGERATIRHGSLHNISMLAVTASFDHRAIDGVVGAQFLSALRTRVEDPFSLLVA